MLQDIIILDHEERYAPPSSNVLRVGFVGDVVYLSIGKYEETATETKVTTSLDQQIAVPAVDLVNAVKAYVESQKRHDNKKQFGDQNLRVAAA